MPRCSIIPPSYAPRSSSSIIYSPQWKVWTSPTHSQWLCEISLQLSPQVFGLHLGYDDLGVCLLCRRPHQWAPCARRRMVRPAECKSKKRWNMHVFPRTFFEGRRIPLHWTRTMHIRHICILRHSPCTADAVLKIQVHAKTHLHIHAHTRARSQRMSLLHFRHWLVA